MFIQKLFAPKWKHRNPEIRKATLQGLNPGKEDSQKIFAEVVKNDSDIGIRRMVVGRLQDLALLQELCRTQELAEAAMKRIRQLLAGSGPLTLDFASRKQAVEQTTDQEMLEHLAREAEEAELRALVVGKIERQSLLGDLAANDPDAAVRLKALEKITQISTLDRVYKSTRLKDKRVSALAKERLDALSAELERPKALKKEARQICLDLESLVQRCKKNGGWLGARARFDTLQSAWQQARAQWQASYGEWDQTLSAGFADLSAQFEERYGLKHEEEARQRAQEEKAEPFKAQRRQVCEDLQHHWLQLNSVAVPDAQLVQDLQSRLERSVRSWADAQQGLAKESGNDDLQRQERDDTAQRYQQLCNELQAFKTDAQAYLKYQTELQQLAEKAQALTSQEEPLDAGAVAALKKSNAVLHKPKRFAPDESLQAQIDNDLQRLSRRLEEQERQKQAHLDEFTALAAELRNAIQAGKSKHATNLANRGKKLLAMIPTRDQRALQKNNALKQFHAALKQLNELQSWRQWSNAPVKEQLCAQMQQLAGEVAANADNPDFDFYDAAQRIKDARAQWKRITAAEPGSSNELWEAFDTACNQAYEPCRRNFEQQAQVRAANLQRREAACASLEQYLEVLSHKPSDLIDWKALDHIVRVAQEEWGTFGPVEREQRAAINQRFRAIIEALRKLHAGQRNRNKEEKELLIKRAEGVLKQIEDNKIHVRDAIDSIKKLQVSWKEVGLAAGDGELWKRFRAACDAVFSRRDQESAAARAERQGIIDQRAAICQAIETIATLQGDALKAAQKDFEDLKQQWAALPSLQQEGKKPTKREPLEQRFRDACRAVEAQNEQRIEQQLQLRLHTQQQQAQLCREGEALWFQCVKTQLTPEQGLQAWDSLEARWRQLPAFSQPVSKALQQRFDSIRDLLQKASESGAESVAESLEPQLPARQSEKQKLCLQIEVLANVESPPEARQARMQYQVSQLAEKMKQATVANVTEEIEELQVKWHLSGVIEPAVHEALESRFERAYQALAGRM